MIGLSPIPTDPREITRVSLEPSTITIDEQLRADVLERAHKEFGYVGENAAARGPLAKALAELGIEPLQTAGVEQYMASKQREWRVNWRPLARAVCVVLPVLVAGALLLTVASVTNWFASSYNGPWGFVAGAVAFLIVVLGELFGNAILFEAIDAKHQVFEQFWKKFALDQKSAKGVYKYGTDNWGNQTQSELPVYPGYVPTHVLNKALEIRTKLPDAKLYVHELNLSYQHIPKPTALPDPFLQVALGSESYWVEVWDEREFEAKI